MQAVLCNKGFNFHIQGFDGELAGLPPSVPHWLGLQTADGNYSKGGALADDNDRGKTFDEIADIIESEPEGLFKSIGDETNCFVCGELCLRDGRPVTNSVSDDAFNVYHSECVPNLPDSDEPKA